MRKERVYQILYGPHVSEKATRVADDSSCVVMKVHNSANKLEIKKAVQQLFGVDVVSVRTVVLKGKVKKNKHGIGRSSNLKKAYIGLKKGQEIDFMETKLGE